jgi:two-component system sensor histidine kinase TctE
VDNALFYSDGPVTLAASTGPAGELVLHVIDRGPGVAIEEREAIFGRFVRGSAGLASPRRGSGIGLSVVRLLIEAMGGRVQVVDHPGGGADFQLVLPGSTGVLCAGWVGGLAGVVSLLSAWC